MSDLLDWTFRGNRSTSGRKPQIKGYRLTKAKDGKVTIAKDPKRLNVIQRLQARTRTRYKRGK
jgi:hypothetical protein